MVFVGIFEYGSELDVVIICELELFTEVLFPGWVQFDVVGVEGGSEQMVESGLGSKGLGVVIA
jgi:hypothetical protein